MTNNIHSFDEMMVIMRRAQLEKAAGELRKLVAMTDYFPEYNEDNQVTNDDIMNGLRQQNVIEIVEKCIKELIDEIY